MTVNSKRQSNFEAMRLLAMFMIVGHHFCEHQPIPLKNLPLGANKIVLEMLFLTQGRVGVDLFFFISIFFICNSTPSVKSSLRKAWVLERTLLFWSLILTVSSWVGGISFPQSPSLKMFAVEGISALLPTFSDIWWYATSYMGFLLLAPFLIKGLRALSQRQHLALALLAGGAGLCTQLPILKRSAFVDYGFINVGFLVLFIGFSYLRWHEPNIFTSRKAGFWCFAIGYAWTFIHVLTGINDSPAICNPATVLESLGLFILFNNLHFSNRAIDIIASHTFSIYLISDFPHIREYLWQRLFILQPYVSTPWAVPYAFAVSLAVYACCIILDSVRSTLFSMTVDRNKGHWFDLAYARYEPLISKALLRNTTQNTKQQE